MQELLKSCCMNALDCQIVDTHLRESYRQSTDMTGNRLNVRRTASMNASFKKATMFSKSWMWSMQISTLTSLLSARSSSSFALLAIWCWDGEFRCAKSYLCCWLSLAAKLTAYLHRHNHPTGPMECIPSNFGEPGTICIWSPSIFSDCHFLMSSVFDK